MEYSHGYSPFFGVRSSALEFPFDRFRLFTIAPIVRREVCSIQAIAIVPIVRVVHNRSKSVSI